MLNLVKIGGHISHYYALTTQVVYVAIDKFYTGTADIIVLKDLISKRLGKKQIVRFTYIDQSKLLRSYVYNSTA